MTLCSEEEIGDLVRALEQGSDDRGAIASLLKAYPEDPRLHFLLGSVLAAEGEALGAHNALAKAVELAPEYHIARYQLGFFELTSGEADAALTTWGPLLRLGEDNCLRKFVEGLTCLIRDEFDAALQSLREGISLNTDNEPLNGDIRLLMGQVEQLRDNRGTSQRPESADSGQSDQSAASVLLGQFAQSKTRH